MEKSLPVWSIPFLLTLAGIAALIGGLSTVVIMVIGLETLAVSAYLVIRARDERSDRRPVANLLPLFPGHLLVLIIIALLDRPNMLAWLWTIIPVATIAYDVVGRSTRSSPKARLSISMILYCILWIDVFFLLGSAVVLHRQISGTGEIVITAAFGLAGTLFLLLGVYRHRIAAKE